MRAHRRLWIRLAASLCVSFVAAGAAPAPSEKPSPAPSDKPAPAAADASVKMELLASGATEKVGGYNPQQVKLSERKPAGVKKAPELSAPLYGEVRFGGKRFLVALDEPKDQDAKLYVDANANGDLTDDPATKWEKKSTQGQDGKELTQYSGSFQLPLPGVEPEAMVSLSAYRFDKNDPGRAQLKTTLLYYADYGYEGDVTLNGATYHALLVDMKATGQFVAPAKEAGAQKTSDSSAAAGPGAGAGAAAGPAGGTLLIDINGDKRFNGRGEMFEAGKPFNVKGTTWVLAAADGTGNDAGAPPVKIVKSDRKVPEIPLPPNHAVGQKITPFTAKRMDGKTVNFPADYKGKVVMLDFWATWCGPCMGEVPNLVQAYDQYHPKGVEILGISLDQANAGNKIKSVTAENKMTWPQVYDGKYWKAAVAEKYGIQSIPAAFLVDGDTGVILAAEGALRGDNLEKALQAALEKKFPQAGARPATAEEKQEAPAAEPAAPAPAADPEPAPAAEPKPKAEQAAPF